MCAVFIEHLQRDRAIGSPVVAIGKHMVDSAPTCKQGSELAGRVFVHAAAITPVDAEQCRGVNAGIDQRADRQHIRRAFIDRIGSADRHIGRHIGDRDILAAGNQERAVFVHHIHRDDAGRATNIAVGVHVLQYAVEGQVRHQNRLVAAVSPMHDVLGHGVSAWVDHIAQRQRIAGAFWRTEIAEQVERRRHVRNGHREAVRVTLESVIVHRDGDCVRRGAVVGKRVLDVEAGRARADREILQRSAIAPVHCHIAARRVLVRRVGEGDGAAEKCPFVDARVSTRIDHDHFGWRSHGDGLGTGVLVHAIFVDQVNRDGARPGTGKGMRDQAIDRQVDRQNDLRRSSIAPVNTVLTDRVGARVIRRGEVQGVGLALFDRIVARHADRRRNVGHDHIEAVDLDTVGLTLLVVDGQRHCIEAVVRQGQVERRRAG